MAKALKPGDAVRWKSHGGDAHGKVVKKVTGRSRIKGHQVAASQQLAAQRALDPTDVKSMHSFFARHAVDRETKTHRWNSDTDPSAGFIAWLLWGGDAGKAWADSKARKLEKPA